MYWSINRLTPFCYDILLRGAKGSLHSKDFLKFLICHNYTIARKQGQATFKKQVYHNWDKGFIQNFEPYPQKSRYGPRLISVPYQFQAFAGCLVDFQQVCIQCPRQQQAVVKPRPVRLEVLLSHAAILAQISGSCFRKSDSGNFIIVHYHFLRLVTALLEATGMLCPACNVILYERVAFTRFFISDIIPSAPLPILCRYTIEYG